MTLIEVVLAVLGGLLTLVVGLLGFIGNTALAKLEMLADKVNTHASALAVLQAATTGKRLDEHDARFAVMDSKLGDIAANVLYCRAMLERDHPKP
jgi:hypothetical protein